MFQIAAEPVLTPTHAHEGDHIADPHVIFDPETLLWRMVYSAFDGDTWRIGHAHSDDLVAWVSDDEPLFEAAAGAAADAAGSAIIRHGIDDDRTLFAVAAAKIRAGEAAGAGAAIAHQVHGAMGFTREYSLHQSTRRLWAWRDDFGAESIWATRLGALAIEGGADTLWPTLTAI